MKKLQNNFTTVEQSKRLLELGVPEWTADLRYRICKSNDSILGNPYLTKGKKYIGSHFNSSLPCWSVGRLIEISRVSTTLPEEKYMFPFWYDTQDNVEWAIRVLESGIRTGNIDFSKLEG